VRHSFGPLRQSGPKVRTVFTILAAVLLVGLGIGQAWRDTTPPSLWTEAPERLAAGQRFELFLSADEPVTYRIVYGAATVEAVEQQFTVALIAQPGDTSIRISAIDGAGNASHVELRVEGVVVPQATIGVPDALKPGSAFTVTVRFEPDDAPAEVGSLSIDGAPATVSSEGALHYAIGAVPLVLGPGSARIELSWSDGLGRAHTLIEPVAYAALDEEVEELRIAASTLALVTPDGRELEAAALDAAKADANHPPRWTAPFIMPVPGHGTSAFASPRRYAPGGRVSFHEGEDLAAPSGTPILATNDGVVLLSGSFPIKGGMTVIDHGSGVTSRYYHQSSTAVTAGQSVVRGEVIGAVGSTGLSTGPHLHWEMRVGERPTDPLAWVGRVRP